LGSPVADSTLRLERRKQFPRYWQLFLDQAIQHKRTELPEPGHFCSLFYLSKRKCRVPPMGIATESANFALMFRITAQTWALSDPSIGIETRNLTSISQQRILLSLASIPTMSVMNSCERLPICLIFHRHL
jgi:hypothetical protein